MINENRLGLGISVWSVAAPALCIFVFTIGTNLLSEGLARAVAGVDRGSAE
jgi:peptide/nickel transport system permease protein